MSACAGRLFHFNGRYPSAERCFRTAIKCSSHFREVGVRKPLELSQAHSGHLIGVNQLVQLQMNLAGIAILRALNQEDH